MRWDPATYLTFGDERARPFRDLMSRVPVERPDVVVDLGCGPGNLTRELALRWPAADVEGIDSSAEMVGRAKADGETDRLRFTEGDLREWRPDRQVDVLTSNATFQWVPGHLGLLPGLLAAVRPGGWFAFQVPGNFGEPSHLAIAPSCASPPGGATGSPARTCHGRGPRSRRPISRRWLLRGVPWTCGRRRTCRCCTGRTRSSAG
jgi:trans-aconitate 2-methyltransferase